MSDEKKIASLIPFTIVRDTKNKKIEIRYLKEEKGEIKINSHEVPALIAALSNHGQKVSQFQPLFPVETS